MTHTSRQQTPVAAVESLSIVPRLIAQGIDRCTSDSWTVRAVDTRPQEHSETGQLVFEAIVQHDQGDTIQVEPIPSANTDAGSSPGYTGAMRVRLQRRDGTGGKYVRLQGRAASLNPTRPVEKTLLFYAKGDVEHPEVDQWTGFEDMGAVHANTGSVSESVTYSSVTEVLIAVIGATRSVTGQETQSDLSAFA